MQIVLKRLSSSDLTLFRTQFRRRNVAKQKGFNLNMNPMDTELYPGIRREAEQAGRGGLPLTLQIAGPNKAPLTPPLARKIVKSPGAKNLRLNGELVDAPENNANQFDDLELGDIALMGFEGDRLPRTISVVLATARHVGDARLFENALRIIGDTQRYMQVLSTNDLERLLDGVDHEHPAFALFGPEPAVEDLIEIVQGNVEAEERIRRRGNTRPISAALLALARQRASEVGEAGESLVNDHLGNLTADGRVLSHSWTSRTNAISPFDFEVTHPDGIRELVDVKSTTGDFRSPLHLSAGELRTCAQVDCSYRLFRVWEIEGTPKLRRSKDIREWARGVSRAVDNLPAGVLPDAFTVDPAALEWEDEEIMLPVDEDEA